MSFLLSRRYRVKTDKREKVLSDLINSGLLFSSPRKEEDGISFEASFFKVKEIKGLLKKWNADVSYTPKGLVSRIFFLKKRKGLLLGGILSFFLIYLSTFYVWSVKIEGNEELSDAHIIRVMQECGFYEGIKKSDVDINEVQNEVLKRCHELSFFSINVHGMVADVVVHERRTATLPLERESPYNLVSDIDAVIVSSLILDGQAMFKVGDTVAKGDLLVSGIMDSTSEGFRLRQAEGKVFGKTNRTLTFSMPLEYYEKSLEREEISRKIRILGYSIGKSVGDDSGSYDLSVEEKKIKLLGFTLPAVLETHKASYYKTTKSKASDFEARAKLLDDYKRYISTELDGASVLSEKLSYSEDEKQIILTAEVSAIENIAVKEKINIKG